MKPGQIVVVADGRPGTIGVVLVVRESVVRVMIWQHRTGRWLSPIEVAPVALSAVRQDNEHDQEQKQAALSNIRRHQGLVPCGGPAYNRYVRVWPSGKQPADT